MLTASRCTSCSRPSVPARESCPACGESTEAMVVEGAGTIVATTVVHRGSAHGPATPYRVAFVDMDGGYRLFGPVVDDVDAGGRVWIEFPVTVGADDDGAERVAPYRFVGDGRRTRGLESS